MNDKFDEVFEALQKLDPDIRRISDIDDVDAISTGLPWVDFVIGVGGIPYGRITEIFGVESIGKTTLALYVLAEAQKQDKVCAFIDTEYAISPDHMDACGVDKDRLIFLQPNSAEDALDSLMSMAEAGVDAVVLDSVATMLPRAEAESDAGKAHMALIARLMSQAMRKLPGVLKKNNTAAIFINQLRSTMSTTPWGPKEVTTGGAALRYNASVRLRLTSGGKIKATGNTGAAVGHKVRVTTVKNKVGVPKRTAMFSIMYQQPIQRESNLLEVSKELGIISSRGGHYYIVDTATGEQVEKLAHGEANAIVRLREEPELYDKILSNVLADTDKLKLGYFSEVKGEALDD